MIPPDLRVLDAEDLPDGSHRALLAWETPFGIARFWLQYSAAARDAMRDAILRGEVPELIILTPSA